MLKTFRIVMGRNPGTVLFTPKSLGLIDIRSSPKFMCKFMCCFIHKSEVQPLLNGSKLKQKSWWLIFLPMNSYYIPCCKPSKVVTSSWQMNVHPPSVWKCDEMCRFWSFPKSKVLTQITNHPWLIQQSPKGVDGIGFTWSYNSLGLMVGL